MRAFPSDVALAKVEIHVTDVCNNRCGFCTTGWVNAEEGPRLAHVPRERIFEQLQKAYEQGARRALFQGGEPTVRRDLGDLLADAHALGYQATTIFTNARMAASKAGARWLTAMGVTWFQVSIQGGTAAAHDASVGAEGAFQQTVAGTRRLIALGQRVKINAVLTRHLLETLAPFAALMIDLAPEEVGLDTVKPSAAFDKNRADYADLLPALGPHKTAIRDAVLQMDAAGITARLTSFPPCLVPGAEHLVSEEANTTLTHQTNGVSVNKLLWKRTLQQKADACRQCAYDATCGGLYAPYVGLHGLGELSPLSVRKNEPARDEPSVEESALTRALRAALVRRPSATAKGLPMAIVRVRRLAGGAHALDCVGPNGAVRVEVRPRAGAVAAGATPPFGRTERFDILYRNAAPTNVAAPPDLTLVGAVLQTLRRIEPRLPSDDS